MMLKIIDSHVHFWQPGQLRYTWLDNLPTLSRPFLPADQPRSGRDWQVEKVVFVEADCSSEQSVAEASWVASLAGNNPFIAGIVAAARLEQGAAVRETLDQLRQIPLVKGVRRLIQSEPRGFSNQPSFIEGVRLLAEYDLSFDICLYHYQFPDVLELVAACPNVRFILDHIGKPAINIGSLDPWRDHMRKLASFPNVQCKLSGLVTEADHEHWEADDLKPYIDHTLASFGSERVMFGSDHPVMRLASTYDLWLGTLRDAVGHLSRGEQHALFHDNARRFYRL